MGRAPSGSNIGAIFNFRTFAVPETFDKSAVICHVQSPQFDRIPEKFPTLDFLQVLKIFIHHGPWSMTAETIHS